MTLYLNDIKPLKEYLGDKKEMIEVIFSCIEDNQVKKMIPDCLKDANMEAIKAECLVELLGMSKKRIIGILEGKELDESSEDSLELSDISDDDSNIKTERESPEKHSSKKKGIKESKNKGGRKVTKVTSSESDQEEEESTSKKKKIKKRKEDSPDKVPPPKKKKNKCEPSKEAVEENITDSGDITLGGTGEKKEGKNLLEILELEMRARAIRSLLEREEKKGKVVTKEPMPSTSNQNKPEVRLDLVDNDPDAVIIIDEAADQIDLTKDESDSEEPTSKSKNDKPVAPQPRIYRNNSQNTASDKQVSKSVENDKSDEGSSQVEASGTYVPRNWTERWLDSNDVQKVMKTTKVLTNLKKRLINVSKQKSLEEKNNEETNSTEPTVIEGTVSEYSQLQKKTPDNDKEIDTLAESTDQLMNLDAELTVETFISKDEMNKITEESEDKQITVTSCETVESNDQQELTENIIETADDSKEEQQESKSATEDVTQSQEETKLLQQDCELIDSESEKDEKSEPEN